MNGKEATRTVKGLGRDLAKLATTACGGEWEPRVYEDVDGHTFDLLCVKSGSVTHHRGGITAHVRSNEGVSTYTMTARTWSGLVDVVRMAHVIAMAGKNEHWR